ncbi:Protein FAM117B [Nymphon striatum]|nr:Protein FAM117B [Nymphon striatum]
MIHKAITDTLLKKLASAQYSMEKKILEKSRTLNNRSSTSTNYSTLSNSPAIRRTSSLDTIYLSGQWPRDQISTFRSYCGQLMVDKAIQTVDDWDDCEKKKSPQKKISGSNEYQLEKYIRQRLQRTKEAAIGTHSHHHHHHHHHSHTSPVQGDHSAISINTTSAATYSSVTSSRAVPIPNSSISKTNALPRMRSSVEGLNQEIEKLVFKDATHSDENFNNDKDLTPDGHRAPIADMLMSGKNSLTLPNVSNNNSTSYAASHNDADTQTPYSLTNSRGSSVIGGLIMNEESGSSSNSSSRSDSRCQSISPLGSIMPGLPGLHCLENSFLSQSAGINGSKENKSLIDTHCKSASPEYDACIQTKLGTSPHINKFLEREPPDGCEKVCVEETKHSSAAIEPSFCPMKPSMNFTLKPSLGSAFCPLEKNYFSQISDRDSSTHVAVSPSVL